MPGSKQIAAACILELCSRRRSASAQSVHANAGIVCTHHTAVIGGVTYAAHALTARTFSIHALGAGAVCPDQSAVIIGMADAAHTLAMSALPVHPLRSAAVRAYHGTVIVRLTDTAHSLALVAASEDTRSAVG